MITLTERTLGIWFVTIGEEADWLGSVWKTDEGYEIAYRFRFYVDDKTFDSEDKKNWYKSEISKDSADDAKMIKTMRDIAEILWVAGGGKRYEVMMESGGIDEFMEEFQKLPFVSAKVMPLNEENGS